MARNLEAETCSDDLEQFLKRQITAELPSREYVCDANREMNYNLTDAARLKLRNILQLAYSAVNKHCALRIRPAHSNDAIKPIADQPVTRPVIRAGQDVDHPGPGSRKQGRAPVSPHRCRSSKSRS
jgi:hypothetical protein